MSQFEPKFNHLFKHRPGLAQFMGTYPKVTMYSFPATIGVLAQRPTVHRPPPAADGLYRHHRHLQKVQQQPGKKVQEQHQPMLHEGIPR